MTTVLLIGRVLTGIAIGAAGPAIKRMVVVGSGENLGRNLGRGVRCQQHQTKSRG